MKTKTDRELLTEIMYASAPVAHPGVSPEVLRSYLTNKVVRKISDHIAANPEADE